MAEKNEKVAVHASPRPRRQAGEDAFAPIVDIYQLEDGTTVLEAEVPGATADKVDVRVDKGVLTIYADGRLSDPPKDYACTYQGFCGVEYFRVFALSDEVDRDRIEATISNGVLSLRLPRAAAARTRKIEIKPG